MEILAAIITWVVLGLIAGYIASLITGTREGIVANIVVGILGAFIGGLILQLFGAQGVTGFNLPSILTAILGAVVLLALVRAFRSSPNSR